MVKRQEDSPQRNLCSSDWKLFKKKYEIYQINVKTALINQITKNFKPLNQKSLRKCVITLLTEIYVKHHFILPCNIFWTPGIFHISLYSFESVKKFLIIYLLKLLTLNAIKTGSAKKCLVFIERKYLIIAFFLFHKINK